MNYLEISARGAVIEQNPEEDKHRYLINEGFSTYNSINELVEKIKEAQERVGWLSNDKEY